MSNLYESEYWLVDLSEIVAISSVQTDENKPYFGMVFRAGLALKFVGPSQLLHFIRYTDGNRQQVTQEQALAWSQKDPMGKWVHETEYDLTQVEAERAKLVAAWKNYLERQ